MSRIRLFPIVLPLASCFPLSLGSQPVAVACQPIARITSSGATRSKGTTVCAHERIALKLGTTSVKLTCLKNQKQVDYKGGSALMACSTQQPLQLMRCPTDQQMICVEPKGYMKKFWVTQTATHLAWLPTPHAIRYKINLSGHGVIWQGELSEANLNYQEIAGLSPGNAYRITIAAYQGETQLSTIDIALNVPSQVTASFRSK